MRQLLLDKNQQELTQHGSADFPFAVDRASMSDFADMTYSCHWHTELEFTLVHTGVLHCKINDIERTLYPGDCMFINSNALHMGWSGEEDCRFSSLMLRPALLCLESSSLKERYVSPILDSTMYAYVFRADKGWEGEVASCLHRMLELYIRHGDCFEMEIVTQLFKVWTLFYRNVSKQLLSKRISDTKSPKLKKMIRFIQENYAEKITLDEIANAANVSKSSCSHLFKTFMREPPFDYLLRYRIEQSLPLLLQSEDSVTEIAVACGFASGSYYAEVFRRFLDVSPLEYKKRNS